MDNVEAEAWIEHLTDYEIVPLFPQFPKSASAIETGTEATGIDARRGWMITNFKLASVCNKLGYARGDVNLDGGGFTEYVKRFPSQRICAVIEFTGSYAGATYNFDCALEALSYHYVGASGRHTAAKTKPGNVPKVLLAETCADLATIAAAGTGFDAGAAEKAGP